MTPEPALRIRGERRGEEEGDRTRDRQQGHCKRGDGVTKKERTTEDRIRGNQGDASREEKVNLFYCG